MAKTKKKKEEEVAEVKSPVIISAIIKDDLCNYGYEIKTGIGIGDTHNVKGKGVIDEDMRIAFFKMNAHLACIDDTFKHAGVEIEDIDQMHNHELTGLFTVTGFTIKGSSENESIIIKGNKYLTSSGGRMELESPKIPLDNLSSYRWWNELKAAADQARNEVELYMQGKCTAVEHEQKDPNQMTIGDGISEAELEAGKV